MLRRARFSPARSTAVTALPCVPGSYLLVLRIGAPHCVVVGRLGGVNFPAGLHVYAGSARGPGGIAARLGRHLRGDGRPRWHVDYLRASAQVVFAGYATGTQRLECRWASALFGLGGGLVRRGLGASDCHCLAHLVAFGDEAATLRRRLAAAGLGIEAWVDAEGRGL